MPQLTKQQIQSLDRRVERQRARQGDEDAKLSLFIRVAESKIYNGKPIHKALLKEVIYLRMTDLTEHDTRIPKGTPFTDYSGWCYAKQEYLANRVGCARETASRTLKAIAKDKYLNTRKYRGRDGAWHVQYFPNEAVIDAKIAELNDDDHVTHDHKPLCATVTCPSDVRSQALVTNRPEPCDPQSQKVCSEFVSEAGVGGRLLSSPPPGNGAAATPEPQEKTKTNPARVSSSSPKQDKTNPEAAPADPLCTCDAADFGIEYLHNSDCAVYGVDLGEL